MKTGAWYYLRILWNEDGLTQRDLSEMTHVAENTTAIVIKAMIADGLVERRRDPLNGRKVRITLTDSGRSLKEKILPYAAMINAVATADIPAAEIEACLITLQKLARNLEAAFAEW